MSSRGGEDERALAVDLLRLLDALTRMLRDREWPAAIDPMAGDHAEARRLLGAIARDLTAAPTVEPSSRGATNAYPPLRTVTERFGLTAAERDVLLLAMAVEMDVRFCRVIALLNDHVGRTRPTLGLASAVAALSTGTRPRPIELAEGVLVRDGLLELDEEGPLPDLAIRVPREVLRELLPGGFMRDVPHVSIRRAPAIGTLAVEDRVRDRLIAWRAAMACGRQSPLIVTGERGAGRRSVAHAVGLGETALLVNVDVDIQDLRNSVTAARREAIWRSAALAVHVAQALDRQAWRELWDQLQGIAPLVVAIPHASLAVAVSSAPRSPFVVELGGASQPLQARIWSAQLPADHGLDDRAIDDLSRRFSITPGRASIVVRHALAQRALAEDAPLSAGDVIAACRATAELGIGALARKLELPYRREDLVVSMRVAVELDLAITWLRERRRILDDWQLGSRMHGGHGFVGLFAGPPGTGKTMAAQVMARELALELYRVDLSCVVSKYIGETEKNLARLFDEARLAGAGLLFDEAEALFGKRTQTRDAHDRYANIEVGYLLQRIEEHDGFVVLTSNRMRDMDEAFVRRFQVILDFQPPTAAERARIWEGMMPAALPREPLNLAQLARFELTGGEIRNVVVAAACLAAGDGRPLSMKHIDAAVRRELSKNGRVVDERLFSSRSEETLRA